MLCRDDRRVCLSLGRVKNGGTKALEARRVDRSEGVELSRTAGRPRKLKQKPPRLKCKQSTDTNCRDKDGEEE